MLFAKPCKACICKDHTIKVLEEQAKFLRDLVSPKSTVNLAQLEADAVLSGNQETVTIYGPEFEEATDETYAGHAKKAKGGDAVEEELYERDALLGGNY